MAQGGAPGGPFTYGGGWGSEGRDSVGGAMAEAEATALVRPEVPSLTGPTSVPMITGEVIIKIWIRWYFGGRGFEVEGIG